MSVVKDTINNKETLDKETLDKETLDKETLNKEIFTLKDVQDTIKDLKERGYKPIKQVLIKSKLGTNSLQCFGISWQGPSGGTDKLMWDIQETIICDPSDNYPGIMLTDLQGLSKEESDKLLIESNEKDISMTKPEIKEINFEGKKPEITQDSLVKSVNNLESINDSLKQNDQVFDQLIDKESDIDKLLTNAKEKTEQLIQKYESGSINMQDLEDIVSDTIEGLSTYEQDSISLRDQLTAFTNRLQETQMKLNEGLSQINEAIISHDNKYKESIWLN